MTGRNYKYVFGPVSSRRLGRSLGLDIVPLKTCTQNCIYCQLGMDCDQTIAIDEYLDIKLVLDELKEKLAEESEVDFITISGSGEPTLNSRIGDLISAIKEMSDIPVAVITNGTLLSRDDVRARLLKADVVMPSLDASDERVFQKINQPHQALRFKEFVHGLVDFKREFAGQIWLEVFFIEGVNTSSGQVFRFKEIIDMIGPDRVQLNTAVRPTVDDSVQMVPKEMLEQIAHHLGHHVEVIADYSKLGESKRLENVDQIVVSSLQRHPCSFDDLKNGLSVNEDQLEETLTNLIDQGRISEELRQDQRFFKLC